MDGRMDGHMDRRRMDGRTDGRMDERTDGWTDGLLIEVIAHDTNRVIKLKDENRTIMSDKSVFHYISIWDELSSS